MSTNYGIREWHDVREVYSKINNLLQQPVRKMRKDALERYYRYFETKCVKSKELVTKAKEIIPGGVQHNLALNHPFPIAMKKAEGAFLWDVDGNKYIDFLQAGGPTILGSNYKPVRDKVIELISESGPVTGLFHEYEYKLADLIKKYMPSIEQFRMLGSGTEGVLAALRIARSFTGNKNVIKICSAYHGWSDQMVYDIRAAGSKNMHAAGIPKECYANVQAVPVNDLDAMEAQLRANINNGGTACVIVEPLGPESGTRPVSSDYNQKLRKLCDNYGALLIFDEVVTAFRVGMGGAQGYFGVTPDLTVFGKALTGGYPAAGAVGGKKEVMEVLAPGLGSSADKVMVGGTLSANPLSCLAGYYAILETDKTDACVKAGLAGDRMRAGLQKLIEKYDLPFIVYNQGSIVHFDCVGLTNLTFTDENKAELSKVLKERSTNFAETGMALMAEGVVTIGASRMYMSLADTDDVVDEALIRFDNIFASY